MEKNLARFYIYIYITESLYCAPGTNPTLSINYAAIIKYINRTEWASRALASEQWTRMKSQQAGGPDSALPDLGLPTGEQALHVSGRTSPFPHCNTPSLPYLLT